MRRFLTLTVGMLLSMGIATFGTCMAAPWLFNHGSSAAFKMGVVLWIIVFLGWVFAGITISSAYTEYKHEKFRRIP